MATRRTAPKRVSKARTSKRKARGPLERLEDELPSSLKAYAHRFRRGLTRLEKDLVKQELSARRKAARLLREASHELGKLEARGEREFKRRATKARKDADRVLKKLERAINPAPAQRKKKKKTAARKTPARASKARSARSETAGTGI